MVGTTGGDGPTARSDWRVFWCTCDIPGHAPWRKAAAASSTRPTTPSTITRCRPVWGEVLLSWLARVGVVVVVLVIAPVQVESLNWFSPHARPRGSHAGGGMVLRCPLCDPAWARPGWSIRFVPRFCPRYTSLTPMVAWLSAPGSIVRPFPSAARTEP